MHEADSLQNVFENLKQLHTNDTYEIIIVDGSTQNDTNRTVTSKEARVLSSRQGRAHQMNTGAAQSHGDILLFLHADTLLPSDTFAHIQNALQEPTIVGGAFDVSINAPQLKYKVLSKMITARSRATRVPFGDQAIFLRRTYFFTIGGFKEIPLMEDLELMKRIRNTGDVITLIPDCVKTSARRWEQEGILYCTMRNWTIRTLYKMGVSPSQLVHFYHDMEKESYINF